MANNTKRNAKGGDTIRKRADGRWEARFSMGFDPKTGKQIQKSVYGQTQKEVLQKLSENGVGIEYLYSFMRAAGRQALIILRPDDEERARQTLSACGVRMLTQEEVESL